MQMLGSGHCSSHKAFIQPREQHVHKHSCVIDSGFWTSWSKFFLVPSLGSKKAYFGARELPISQVALVVKNSPANAGEECLISVWSSWVRKIPWRRVCQSTPELVPGESHGQRESGDLQSIGSQRVGHGTTDWFQIGKAVHQGCILSPCLFKLCRVHHVKCWAGWSTDCRKKYQ